MELKWQLFYEIPDSIPNVRLYLDKLKNDFKTNRKIVETKQFPNSRSEAS